MSLLSSKKPKVDTDSLFSKTPSGKTLKHSFRRSLDLLVDESSALLSSCQLLETGDTIVAARKHLHHRKEDEFTIGGREGTSVYFWMEKDQALRVLEADTRDLEMGLEGLRDSGLLRSGVLIRGRYSANAFMGLIERAKDEQARCRACISRGLGGLERRPILDEECGEEDEESLVLNDRVLV